MFIAFNRKFLIIHLLYVTFVFFILVPEDWVQFFLMVMQIFELTIFLYNVKYGS